MLNEYSEGSAECRLSGVVNGRGWVRWALFCASVLLHRVSCVLHSGSFPGQFDHRWTFQKTAWPPTRCSMKTQESCIGFGSAERSASWHRIQAWVPCDPLRMEVSHIFFVVRPV